MLRTLRFALSASKLHRQLGSAPSIASKALPTASWVSCRRLSQTRVVLKKNKRESAKAAKSNSSEEPPSVDVAQVKDAIKKVEEKFKDAVEQFGLKAAEVRQGKGSSEKIGRIRVTLSSDEGTAELRSISNIQMKNNNRTIVLTVFEPRHAKYVTAAVLQELGVTPQVDPRNSQVVTISLPTRTADAKKDLVKQVKEEYEHFRNSPSKHCLTAVREDIMKHIKKWGKTDGLSTDETMTFTKQVETLFKKHSNDLSDSLRAIEKSIMQEK